MLHHLTHEAERNAEAERAAAEARLEDLARRRREAEEATAAADRLAREKRHGGDGGGGSGSGSGSGAGGSAAADWTATYRAWADWQDPDELAAKEAEERARLERASKRAPTSCSHDHAAERAIYEMPMEEKMVACRSFKARGNMFFREGQFGLASEQYNRVLIYYEYAFPESDKQQKELDGIRIDSLTNLAACCIRLGRLDEALDNCNIALYADPGNAKALYRRAQARRMRHDFADARADVEAALAAAPDDTAVQREARMLANAVRAYKLKTAGVARTMFGSKGDGGASDAAGAADGEGGADVDDDEAVQELLEATAAGDGEDDDDAGGGSASFVTSASLIGRGDDSHDGAAARGGRKGAAAPLVASASGAAAAPDARGAGASGEAAAARQRTTATARRPQPTASKCLELLSAGDAAAAADGAGADDDGWAEWRSDAVAKLRAEAAASPPLWIVAAVGIAAVAATVAMLL
mmetsp:Transcript_13218/g.46243  ORF Transcript_13218/g.46243 Transcript_13218/m.46243 type:complete len:470 (-) Transcript_13218:129-1538(-)